MTGLYFIGGAIVTAGTVLGYIWWTKSSIQKDVHKLIIDQYELTAKVVGMQLLQNQHIRRIKALEERAEAARAEAIGKRTGPEKAETEEFAGWRIRYDGPLGQRRLYCPHCLRYSGLDRPRPFCPWCGSRVWRE